MTKIKRFNEVPDGWVNVKIDEQIFKRLIRYIPALDRVLKNKGYNKFDMLAKVKGLSQIEEHIKNDKISIHDKISSIVILQYLKEIRNHFNASTAGFLLEGFLATLIYGRLTAERAAADLISKSYDELEPVEFISNGLKLAGTRSAGGGHTYQIKFYKDYKTTIRDEREVNTDGTFIRISWQEDKLCDFYTICLKRPDKKIDICILDREDLVKYTQKNKELNKDFEDIDEEAKRYIKTKTERDRNGLEVKKKYIVVKTNLLKNANRVTLDTESLDVLIASCGEKLQKYLGDVFDTLSTIHYDIDTLITGYDSSGKKKIDVDNASAKCKNNLNELTKKIDSLTGELKNN